MSKLKKKKNPKQTINKLGPYVRLLLPNEQVKATRTFIIGRSGSGKTTLAVQIVRDYFLSRVNRFFVICPTFLTQQTFSPLWPFVVPDDVFINRSDDLTFDIIRSRIDEDLKEHPEKRFLLFIDDVAADNATNKGRKGSFASLSVEAPHINLSIMALFQQAKACSPAFRNNADNIIIFTPGDKDATQCFREEFNPFVYQKLLAAKYDDFVSQIWMDGHFLFIHRPARHEVMSFVDFDSQINIQV